MPVSKIHKALRFFLTIMEHQNVNAGLLLAAVDERTNEGLRFWQFVSQLHREMAEADVPDEKTLAVESRFAQFAHNRYRLRLLFFDLQLG